MRGQILRILLLALLVGAWVTANHSVDAKDEPKQKAQGVGKLYYDLSLILGLPEGTVTGQSTLHFNFEAPDKGYLDTYNPAGPWIGSWGHIEAREIFVGTYTGSIAEIVGCPVVWFWGKYVAGEDFVAAPFDQLLGLPAYENLEGYFKITGYVDGGPGHENDGGFAFPAIPPNGLPFLPYYGDGELQTRWLFGEIVASGSFESGMYTKTVAGDINIHTNIK